MLHTYDLIIVGLTLDAAGGFSLAKGFMMKRPLDALREAQTRLGGNSTLVRSALLQRSEAVVGGGLLMLGFTLQLLGNFHGPAADALGWINSAARLLVVIVAAVAITFGLLRVGRWYAERTFSQTFSRGGDSWKVD